MTTIIGQSTKHNVNIMIENLVDIYNNRGQHPEESFVETTSGLGWMQRLARQWFASGLLFTRAGIFLRNDLLELVFQLGDSNSRYRIRIGMDMKNKIYNIIAVDYVYGRGEAAPFGIQRKVLQQTKILTDITQYIVEELKNKFVKTPTKLEIYEECISELREIFTEFREPLDNDHLEQCPIYCEPIFDKVTTNCGHSFERGALFEHLKRVSTCPLCRTQITVK
jgi:hypothetical protein